MSSTGQEQQSQIDNWRVNLFLVVAVIIFVVFILQLFNLQILEGTEWQAEAELNRTETISLRPLRGVIYDRNGIILAQNIASYNIAVIPANLPDDEGEIEEILTELSAFTVLPLHFGDIELEPLIQCGSNLGMSEMVSIGSSFSPFTPVLVECDVPRERALVIQEKAIDWPGVSILIEPVRDYPTGDITSTFIGFTGPITALREEALSALGFLPNRDKIGYAGTEYYFDEVLRGTPGQRVVEVDVGGAVLRDLEGVLNPEDGLNVVLTIDMRLQAAADAILKGEINFWNSYFGEIRASSGVAIAMNPKTGEILAMVSWPTYENNRLARFIPLYYYEQLIADATQPLLNHAVGAELPAGSVFKLVTGVGALNEGVVTPEQFVKTPGLITINNVYTPNDPGASKEFVDWNRAGFGQLDFIGGLSNSSNVYFYKLGGGYEDEIPEGLGVCRLKTYAEAMGFNQLLGVELPDEIDGLIPDPTWKRITQGENWSTGDTYIAAVGQGFVISTPLQILVSAATIANDGVLMRPSIIREVLDGEGNTVPIVFDADGNWLVDLGVSPGGNILGDVPVDPETGEPVETVIMSPFTPDAKWDLKTDPLIKVYENPNGIGACKETGETKAVEPWVFDWLQAGMRAAVTQGTLEVEFDGLTVAAAGKTGTAEYCDLVALTSNRCIPGNWPTHAWTVAYAPYDDPEIVVVAFLYNGGEGASVAGPVVKKIIEAYFGLKAIDAQLGAP